MAHEGHEHGPDCNHEHDDDAFEIEVVELEDENGEKEEFAILEEVDFEGRHFCVLAPLAEVQAQSEGKESEEGLSLEIFEVKDDMFTALEDEDMAERLMQHLDEVAAKLEAEEEKD